MIRKIFLIILIIFTLAFYGIALAISWNTLIPFWIPLVVSLFLSLLSGILLSTYWHPLTLSKSFWLNYAVHSVFLCGVLLCIFYAVNSAFPRRGSLHEEKCLVTKKIVKERHHSRRVGRGRYVQGEAYKVYSFEVRFPDGSEKEFPASIERYRRLHLDDTISLNLEEGFFGVPIVRRGEKYVDVPHADRRSKIRNARH